MSYWMNEQMMKKCIFTVLTMVISCLVWGYEWIDPKTMIKWRYHYDRYGEYTSSPRWEIELGSEGKPAIDSEFQGHLVVPSEIDGKELHYLGGSSHCGAFQGCTKISSVDLPAKLREISWWSFKGCVSLSKVKIPSGVRIIGNEAFEGCCSLKTITIPEGVVEIGWDAFSGCAALENVSLPSTLKKVGGDVFSGCVKLKEITVRSHIEQMGKNYGANRGNDMLTKAIAQFNKATIEGVDKLEKDEVSKHLQSENEQTTQQAEEQEKISRGWHKENGKWYSPEEWSEECYKRNAWEKIRAKCRSSRWGIDFNVIQALPTGSICRFYDGVLFFTHNLTSKMYADGDALTWNKFYWCGTYSYDSREGFRTLNCFTDDKDTAIMYARKMFKLFNKGDKRFNDVSGNDMANPKTPQTAQRSLGTGTGFYVAKDVIATCAHVISEAKKIVCFGKDQKEHLCKIIAQDSHNDVAILKVENMAFDDYLAIEKRPRHISDKVFTIGYPLSAMIGAEPKYAEGVIGAINGLRGDTACYQISVPVQPGNSGGPLLDAKTGGVVGLVSAKLSDAATLESAGVIPQGINYAVKVRHLVDLLESANITFADTTQSDESDPDVGFAKNGTVLIMVFQ